MGAVELVQADKIKHTASTGFASAGLLRVATSGRAESFSARKRPS
jgi:hypothetical protein